MGSDQAKGAGGRRLLSTALEFLGALTPAADVHLSADDADAIDAILSGAAPVTGPP
jgi:hypothetical protein